MAVRIGGSGPTVPEPDQPTAAATDSNRALIPIAAVTTSREPPSAAGQRVDAGFLAQLIATAGQMPQTRERRRAEPEDVIAAYRSTVNGARSSTPSRFSRST